jgi:hypothetical protein
MTDDIVTRLRGQRTNGVLCNEAADEIEWLRAEIDDRSALIADLADLLVPFSSILSDYEQEMFFGAVRDE